MGESLGLACQPSLFYKPRTERDPVPNSRLHKATETVLSGKKRLPLLQRNEVWFSAPSHLKSQLQGSDALLWPAQSSYAQSLTHKYIDTHTKDKTNLRAKCDGACL